ncbi:hypothetical protein MNV49_003268 [Pseudohyphozyma bogoriensis]|nr:hypothetical protein MNV49_003268 [Pseudohyphozyma bogoriensis]
MLRSLAPLPNPSPSPSSSSSSPSFQPSGATRKLVDFSSNDYLSFSTSPHLAASFLSAFSGTSAQPSLPSPYGPPSSRLLDGNTTSHLQLEHKLSSFLSAPSALLFNSGFDANVAVWTTLPGPDDYVVYDELVHASIHDGMRASRVPEANRRKFRHNDVMALKEVLEEVRGRDEGVRKGSKCVWVAVESLYSMDGDLAPLREIVEAVESVLGKEVGQVVVDEAHSTGLYGPRGRGLVAALGLENRVAVRVHTFGKAMACSGAVVLSSPLIRNYLINYARPLIYSTVMPHMNVVAIDKAFDMLIEGRGEAPAAHLHSLSTYLLRLLSVFLSPTTTPLSLPSISFPTSSSSLPTTTPIIPLLTSQPRVLSSHLISKGYLVRPITYPTVPKGEERRYGGVKAWQLSLLAEEKKSKSAALLSMG